MSIEFMSLDKEYIEIYEASIDQMLKAVIVDDRFENTIRHLCNEALVNNWTLDKKVNIINIITNN